MNVVTPSFLEIDHIKFDHFRIPLLWFEDECVTNLMVLRRLSTDLKMALPCDVISLIIFTYIQVQSRQVPQVSCCVQTTVVNTSLGLYAFGSNNFWQLGNGKEPKGVSNGDYYFNNEANFVKIASGGDHSIGLTQDGHIYGWGYNSKGQLGLGDNKQSIQTMTKINVLGDFINCGGDHTVVINKGELIAFGYNLSGQLGIGTNDDYKADPQHIKPVNFKNVYSCSSGYKFTIILTDAGAFGAGNNEHGQLGIGSLVSQNLFTLIGTQFLSVSSGGHHVLALGKDGMIYAWGRNREGQLGIGNYQDKYYEPHKVKIGKLQHPIQLSAGGYHSMVLSKEFLYGWGKNSDGQLATRPEKYLVKTPKRIYLIGGPSVAPVVTKSAERKKDALWSGDSDDSGDQTESEEECDPGQQNRIANNDQILYVATGRQHTIVLTKQKQIYGWGDNSYNQLLKSSGDGAVKQPTKLELNF
jgi:alpha-tubulin suppressor-like RCC1 family protein